MNFYESGTEVLKIKKGVPSNMWGVVRVSGPQQEGSHMTYGNLVEGQNQQFFARYAPQIAPGSFIQVRQDCKDDDSVDVSIICPKADGRFKQIKDVEWHHRPKNKGNFYYTQFVTAEKCLVQIAIGSCIPESEFYKKTYECINENWITQ